MHKENPPAKAHSPPLKKATKSTQTWLTHVTCSHILGYCLRKGLASPVVTAFLGAFLSLLLLFALQPFPSSLLTTATAIVGAALGLGVRRGIRKPHIKKPIKRPSKPSLFGSMVLASIWIHVLLFLLYLPFAWSFADHFNIPLLQYFYVIFTFRVVDIMGIYIFSAWIFFHIYIFLILYTLRPNI